MEPFKKIVSIVAPLPVNDVDTDQIIPARFLKITDKSGLGANLFSDWRYLPDGSPNPDFILSRPAYQNAKILFAGINFGCGSSREHAPWALTGYGFRAVIAQSFGDIFRNNALKNGLLPVQVDTVTHQRMTAVLAAEPAAEWHIDLEQQTVALPDGTSVYFDIDPFSKHCILAGKDELDYLLSFLGKIEIYEQIYHK